jgi:hypothetical protein
MYADELLVSHHRCVVPGRQRSDLAGRGVELVAVPSLMRVTEPVVRQTRCR